MLKSLTFRLRTLRSLHVRFYHNALANKVCLNKLKNAHVVATLHPCFLHFASANRSLQPFNLIERSEFGKRFRQSSRYLSSSKMDQFLTDKFFINAKWEKAGSTFPIYNPHTGKVIGNAADCTRKDAEDAVKIAYQAFKKWKKTYAKERAAVLQKWYDLIMQNKVALAELLTMENGKPVRESVGEIAYAASFIQWLAEEAKRTYGITIPNPSAKKRLMSIKQPIGVAGMITPWNFPCAMITRKACAAIAAGCTVVLKPSEDTPFSALALAKLSQEAGLPAGVLNILPSSRQHAQEIGEVICQHPDVAALSFTGSTATGKALLRQSAGTVKKVSMELGGLAPFIVFDAADIDLAVANTMICKFRYMGQTCVCANRIFVQEGIHDQYVEKLAAVMKAELLLGDPMDHKTTFGPMINEKAVLKVEAQVEDAIKKGGKVLLGGARGKEGDNYYQPTLITGVTPEMRCCHEETFGPIAPIIKFKTEEEVIALANDTRVGLAGYFFSKDVSQCWRVAEELEVGMVGINEGLMSCAEAPFGGVKESGLGREGSLYALDEYMEIKYMCWGV